MSAQIAALDSLPGVSDIGITLETVTKQFGKVVAVREVSLEIEEGSSSRCSARAVAARRRPSA